MIVGTYYYAWYKGEWLNRTVRKTDPPLLGEYNNKDDVETVVKHMLMMRDCGIDFISLSYGYNNDIEHVLKAAEIADIKVTCFYESLMRASDKEKGIIHRQDFDSIVKDLEVFKKYIEHPNWMKIDNKPLIMMYVTRCFKAHFDLAFTRIRNVFNDNVYLVGDDFFWKPLKNHRRIEFFDAVTSYNFYVNERLKGEGEERARRYNKECKQIMRKHIDSCKTQGKKYWPVVMPGYNDTGVRADVKHRPLSRMDGEFFRSSLRDAFDLVENVEQPVVMITSWNEWYEDTQIEPTESYDDKYLKILRKGLDRFKRH